MSEFLAFGAVMVFLWASLGMVKPAWARLPHRWAALGVFIASLLVLGMLPDPAGDDESGPDTLADWLEATSEQRAVAAVAIVAIVREQTGATPRPDDAAQMWACLDGAADELDNSADGGIGASDLTVVDSAMACTVLLGWTATGESAGTSVPVSRFGSGMHLVGSDIEPGTYRARAGRDGCFWERLSGLGGDIDDIIAGDIVYDGSAFVTIAATDRAFSSEGCGQWVRIE